MSTSWKRELGQLLPFEVLAALGTETRNHELHLVGGAIRDHLLGRTSPDLDFVTSGGGVALGRRLATRLGGRFIELGKERFASYRIVAPSLVIDLWDRKTESIEADLARRDLTVNSIAVAVESGEQLDPFDGRGDLERRILRATTVRSFTGDALRILRLARFAATLEGFRSDAETLALAHRAVALVDEVASERVRDEIDRILAAHGRAEAVGLLTDLGLYPRLWSGRRPASADEIATLLERLAAIEPTIRTLTTVARGLSIEIDPVVVSHALLFRGLAEDAVAAAQASPLLTRHRRGRVVDLLELETLAMAEPESRWFLHRWGDRWPEAVTFDALTAGDRPDDDPPSAAQRLADLARTHGEGLFAPGRLLTGGEVAHRLGIAPGPRVGAALAALERAQVEGRVSTVAEARRFVDSWDAGSVSWRPSDAG